MGTLLEVRVPDLPPAAAVAAIREVRAEVERLESAMTLFRPGSPLVRLNAAAEGRWLHVPPDLVQVLVAARTAATDHPGGFDPTVAPVMRSLGLHESRAGEVSVDAEELWAERSGPESWEIDTAGSRVRRLDARVEFDLGGIGKGLASDRMLDILRAAGSGSALVNFGGMLSALGSPEHRPQGWRVGIAHPYRSGEVWRELDLAGGHLATSGVSERRLADGTHHLLDPATGRSVQGVASHTVWHERGVTADVLSTAGFVALGTGRTAPGIRCWTMVGQVSPGAQPVG